MSGLLQFLRGRYAVFALLIFRFRAYLVLTRNPSGIPKKAPRQLKVRAMRTFFDIIEGGFIAAIAFGVFTATVDITTVASMGL